jgi:hypothetical protein
MNLETVPVQLDFSVCIAQDCFQLYETTLTLSLQKGSKLINQHI